LCVKKKSSFTTIPGAYQDIMVTSLFCCKSIMVFLTQLHW